MKLKVVLILGGWNMTRFKFVIAAIAALLLAGSLAPAKADTWRGTAPFCAGECLPGEKQIATSNCGDGACCATGHKVLCRNSSPTCKPKPIKAQCFLFILMCDNGCSKFACGACFGFGN